MEGGKTVISFLKQYLYWIVESVLFFLGILFGAYFGESGMKEEAVRKGHAEWVVDCAGKNQFKWKEVKP
jgi:hypothetical protein